MLVFGGVHPRFLIFFGRRFYYPTFVSRKEHWIEAVDGDSLLQQLKDWFWAQDNLKYKKVSGARFFPSKIALLGGGNSNIFGIFPPNPGEIIQFDSYFSNGLVQPPTSLAISGFLIQVNWYLCMRFGGLCWYICLVEERVTKTERCKNCGFL